MSRDSKIILNYFDASRACLEVVHCQKNIMFVHGKTKMEAVKKPASIILHTTLFGVQSIVEKYCRAKWLADSKKFYMIKLLNLILR